MKLWNYIKGSREGKVANSIEKDAMKDPFLADALEGFDSVKDNHIKAMESLRKQVTAKTSGKKNGSFRVWAVVAAVMVAVGAGAFFLTQSIDTDKPEGIAKADIQPDKQPERDIIALRSTPPPVSPMMIEEEEADDAAEVQEDETAESEEALKAAEAAREKEEMEAKAKAEKEEKARKEAEKKEAAKKEAAKKKEAEKKASSAKAEDKSKKDTPAPAKKETNNAKKETTAAAKKASGKKAEPAIRGWITDKSGKPLVGASVFLSGTKKATVSDADGYFELTSKKAQNIQVNYLGYKSVTQRAELSKMTLVVLYSTDDKPSESEADSQKKTANLKKPVPVKGEKEFNKYLTENLIRPKDECKDVKGEVVVAFSVDGNGRPYKIRVVQSLCPAIDREAIRLVRKGPNWKRGDTEGTVRIKF